jgi:hypothetical protein
MSMFGDIGNLSNLLQESAEAEKKRESTQAVPPSSTGLTVVKGRGEILAESATAKKEKDNSAIWEPAAVPLEDALLCTSENDGRPVPRYEFSYKQMVGTEDTFLGMGGKSAATTDCTHLVVKVHFPGATMRDLDLDVTKNRIRAESKDLKLFTYLPVNVYSDKGKAQFDVKRSVLSVTLPIISFFDDPDREY